jgi:periplasmic protein TonB
MRRSFTIASIGAHTVVIAGVLYGQILADSTLPTPHRPVLFDASQFMPIDVHPPPPPRIRSRDSAKTVSADAAPLVAPSGVTNETGHENDRAPAPGTMIPGVDSGPPAAIGDIGGTTVAPPPPPPPAVVPVRLRSGMTAPVKIADVAPIYPVIARNAHIQGVVILEAVLTAQGGVESVRVLRSIPLLDQAAVDAVRQWRYTPTLLNGQAVPIVMTVTVNFTLQ